MKNRVGSKSLFNIPETEIQYSLELTNQPNQTRKHSLSDDLESQDPNKQLLPKTSIESTHSYFYCFKNYCINFWSNNKYEIVNKLISIFLHIFIMIVFEIYFYFKYVVVIERTKFMDKINSYFDELGYIHLTPAQSLAITNIVDSNQLESYLYKKYLDSLKRQQQILAQLLIVSCQMAGAIGIVLVVMLCAGLAYRKNIKWNWILIENILMFLFLGIFEYFFFTNVILKYDPVTDDEIRYFAYMGFANYLNNTN